MDNAVIAILAVLVGLILGVIGGYFGRKILSRRRGEEAQSEATHIMEQAREQERVLQVQAKEEVLKIRSAGEAEVREWRSEVQRMERRVSNREENVERRTNNIDRRERNLTQRETEAEELAQQLRVQLEEMSKNELEKLEAISNLSLQDAKDELRRRAEEEIDHELARLYRDKEEQARDEADVKARDIVAQAVQRLASEVVSEATLTTIPLPSDDMKGRLIGREGRNIRAIEKATGVDLIIDETPEAVSLSCFDPIRREVARLAVSNLIKDGRIHPARIEEMTEKAEKEVEETIRKSGEQAVFDVDVQGLHPEMIKLLGRLKYRYSFGENVLQHSVEVCRLAGMMAGEIGANVRIAKTGGLLHDIGKALTHEVDGPHAEIGAEVATKYEMPPPVCTAIGEHHNDDMSTVEAFLVAAADAISAARPGARRDTVESYIKRLEAIEEVCTSFSEVEKCFAIQAGREVRVLVNPSDTDDVASSRLARNIAKKIQDDLVYPGQIKVIVIRENRAVEYAR